MKLSIIFQFSDHLVMKIAILLFSPKVTLTPQKYLQYLFVVCYSNKQNASTTRRCSLVDALSYSVHIYTVLPIITML